MPELLNIKDLYVNAGSKEILKGLNLTVNAGEIHVIMGPNGAGKSTLANVIFNHPSYEKIGGSVFVEGEDTSELTTDAIARKGVFMSFQLPEELSGISDYDFLKYVKEKNTTEPLKRTAFRKELKEDMKQLGMNTALLDRSLNLGFSGGEKKKNEILQMLVLNPKLAILDETDSGLDVDAVRTVNRGIELYHNENNALIIITHNDKILEGLKVDYVHVLVDGKIVKTGDSSLAAEIQSNGFEDYKN